MKICASCQKPAPDDASFCSACGAALASPAAPPESTLLKWLRKLGIYRSGATASVYHNALERPAELQMDGVFDASKDLVTRDDRRKPSQPPQKGPGR